MNDSHLDQMDFNSEPAERLAQSIQAQSVRVPPAYLRERILKAARGTRESWPFHLQWAAGLTLVIVLWFVFGAIVQPGVTLSWNAEGEQPTEFLIYRAEAGTDQFDLVAEISSVPGQAEYTYLDRQYFPGNTFQYQVEGIGSSGVVLNSVVATAGSANLFPVYLFLFGLSVAASYALVVLGGLFRQNRLVTAA